MEMRNWRFYGFVYTVVEYSILAKETRINKTFPDARKVDADSIERKWKKMQKM